MKLAIKLSQQENGTFRAWCPALPGCVVCEQTREDARSHIRRAIQGYLASLDVPLQEARCLETAAGSPAEIAQPCAH
ncbi:hypothetical protein LCGC14_1641550 [marine sediment metagenome]|uniref:HicB-like antitoxin of toxin-antitoxin system domain-containing protein n=1 Tax=marine sediment metagenome TaxID=412755 RepID=A0A0F9ILX8_9ZZZZ